MFEMTLVDHLRLTFGHVVYRHRVHAQRARLHTRWSRGLRALQALLMAGVAYAAVGAALDRGSIYAIVCAVLAGLTMVVLLLHLIVNSEARAAAHHAAATRLWRIRDHYQALLSDLADGAITMDVARMRRDSLSDELHDLYETAPPADYEPHETAAHAAVTADEAALADAEIDRFLPKSLHKPMHPPPANVAAG